MAEEELLNKENLAWLAGFIDGEGCISIRRSGDECYLQLVIGNTHKPIIDRLKSLVGGGIYKDKKQKSTHKQSWRVTCSGKQAKSLLRIVYPYLFTKKAQASVALVFPIYKHGNGIRKSHPLHIIMKEECHKRMSILNRKGAC